MWGRVVASANRVLSSGVTASALQSGARVIPRTFRTGANRGSNYSSKGAKWVFAAGATALALGGGVVLAEDGKSDHLKAAFERFATVTKDGERFMTPEDFLRSLVTPEGADKQQGDQLLKAALDGDKFKILFQVADLDRSGLISFKEYSTFEHIINKPEAEYLLAFRLFDRENNGYISKEDFKQVVATALADSNFNFDCELMQLYFGHNNQQHLTYPMFTQLLKDLQQERVRQEFRAHDAGHNGYISADKFAQIVLSVKLRQLPDSLKDTLPSVAQLNKGGPHEGMVSYAQFVAANDMLLHIPSYGRVLRAALSKTKQSAISKEEFMREARLSTSIEITPLEVDLIFHLFDRDHDGKLSLADFNTSTGANSSPKLPTATQALNVAKPSKFVDQVMETVQNFALGSVAGAVGASAVYPIDLVKTRMQNQRVIDPAKRLYNNSWDCFKKVVRNEGVRGLYKGLGPQVVGVAPEKAIKLTVNDLLRNLFEDKSKGEIYFPLEVLAGGGAGASQVLFTNPLEIVKIRLQVQGEAGASSRGAGAIAIIRELGFFGLYKGAGACLLRDIPFSAIYFPTYAKMKDMLKDENGKLGAKELLLAGAVAGIPAASLVTPADVIKTRLQVKARTGEQTYDGIVDCARKVWAQEGFSAFWKGTVARVFRSSPQFGVTLLSYELLHKWFAPESTPRPPTNAPVTPKDFAALRPKAEVVVSRMESKFGLVSKADKSNDKSNGDKENPKH